ncbi:hypothetical protein ES703_95746 [subsurface metagenome]
MTSLVPMRKIACKVFEVLVLGVFYLIVGLIDAWWALRKRGKKKRGEVKSND